MADRGFARYAMATAICSALSTQYAWSGWQEIDFNPQPVADDILLPMPCDGQIAFRKIMTQETGTAESILYADRSIWMGWSGARETAFIESEWQAQVAGALSDEFNRYYLLGKYEITSAQYRAVMDDDCPPPGDENGLPAVGLTWFDAVAFADRYTRWLYANKPEALPAAVAGSAFARLPTEAEWEFAVRGGLAVAPASQRNERFFSTGSVTDYGWHAGTDSSNGELQYIGALDANPLGLHDVYGNVAEIVLDSFRVNKAGRLAGQPGAMIAKGGSYRSAASEIRSGGREEVAHYIPEIDGASLHRNDVGMRLAIAGAAVGDLQFSQKLAEGWPLLVTSDTGGEATPSEALTQMADRTSDLAVKAEIDRIALAVGRTAQEHKEYKKEALDYLAWSGAVTARRLYGLYHNINKQLEFIDENWQSETGEARTNRAAFDEALGDSLREFGITVEIYAETFRRAFQSEFGKDEVLASLREQVAQWDGRNLSDIADYIAIFGKQLSEHDAEKGYDTWDIVLAVLSVIEQRNVSQPEWFDRVPGR